MKNFKYFPIKYYIIDITNIIYLMPTTILFKNEIKVNIIVNLNIDKLIYVHGGISFLSFSHVVVVIISKISLLR